MRSEEEVELFHSVEISFNAMAIGTKCHTLPVMIFVGESLFCVIKIYVGGRGEIRRYVGGDKATQADE